MRKWIVGIMVFAMVLLISSCFLLEKEKDEDRIEIPDALNMGENTDEVIEFLDEFLAENPGDPQGHVLRGTAKLVQIIAEALPHLIGEGIFIGPLSADEGAMSFPQSPDQIASGRFRSLEEIGFRIRSSLKQLEALNRIREISPELSSMAFSSAIASFAKTSTDWLEEIEELQDTLEGYISELEAIWEDLCYLQNDIIDSNVKLFLNQFDWNGDGVLEPDKELRLLVTWRDWDYNQHQGSFKLYSNIFLERGLPDIYYIESIEIDPAGGDAIFDFEFFDAMAGNIELDWDTYVPVFDDNDYITIDEGDIAVIKIFLDMLMSSLMPFLVYDLTPSADFVEYVNEIADGREPLPEDFDLNNDGNITTDEIKQFIGGDFLAFRDTKSADRLSSIRDYLCNMPVSMEVLRYNLLHSTKTEENRHNLTSPWFVEYTADDDEHFQETISEIDDMLDYIRPDGKDIDIEADLGEGDLLIHLYAIFDNPEAFSDLLSFVPSIYNYEDFDELSIVFPDETFGGLLTNFPKTLLPEDF